MSEEINKAFRAGAEAMRAACIAHLRGRAALAATVGAELRKRGDDAGAGDFAVRQTAFENAAATLAHVEAAQAAEGTGT